MKSMRQIGAVAVAALSITTVGFGMSHEVVNTDDFNLNIGGRIQEVAYGELVHDPVPSKDNARAYLFLKQARLNLNGRVNGVKYNTEWVGAAEDVNGSNNGLTLLDFSFDVPLWFSHSTWLKVGQFKVPYGREMINDDGQFQFVEHSVDHLAFNNGRDVGAALHQYAGKFAGTVGVFTGGARDVPLRFLPEHLGVPEVVGRFGFNDGLDKDIFTVTQNDLHPQRVVAATYVNGLYMRDTRIGHSTVLNVRTTDRSLLMNPNWNPFLAKTPLARGEFWQGGWDAAARGPIAAKSAWTGEVETDYAAYRNNFGHLRMWGARAQAGLLCDKFEMALRYAFLQPDRLLSNGGVPITNNRPIQEITPAFSYYINGHDHKVVVDFPLLVDVPVFIENIAGAYVSVEQPDQASVIKPTTGRVERQTVPEVRVMYQLAF